MAEPADNDNPINWVDFLFNTVAFVWGFLLGGATGYFGNWLWEKFRPRNKSEHLTIAADKDGAYFSGRMTQGNKDQVLKTLKATATPTSLDKTKTYGKSETGASESKNSGSSK
ncbi:MAG: hypothetical protein SV201_04790 [Pseudomonadota bacterium]|nr:hypothetical protein [Pseudomonadota bacterium]